MSEPQMYNKLQDLATQDPRLSTDTKHEKIKPATVKRAKAGNNPRRKTYMLEHEAEIPMNTGDEVALDPSVLDSSELGGEDPTPGPHATPGGFTIVNARDQMSGLVKNWTILAPHYEGEDRAKFDEIGKRLAEILNVLNRDFVQDADNSAEQL